MILNIASPGLGRSGKRRTTGRPPLLSFTGPLDQWNMWRFTVEDSFFVQPSFSFSHNSRCSSTSSVCTCSLFSAFSSWLSLTGASVENNKCHVRSDGHEESVRYYRVQEGYFPGQWKNSRFWCARHTHPSTNWYGSCGHGAFHCTP